MSRKIYSIQQREKLIQRAQIEFKYRSRVRQLYNYIYKHSAYYRVSFALRIMALVLSIYILYLNKLIIFSSKEIVADARVEEFHIGKKNNNMENRDLILYTRTGNEYAVGFSLLKDDIFLKNDTIEIVKNIAGKKTYIVNVKTKHFNQVSKYRRFDNFLIFIAVSNFLSLLVFDAYDFLYRVYIRIIFILNIITIAIYLFM
ncbi:MAG TPA: hypothetical protein VNY73_09535 [Bacteroidia bacterium]|jgi:hypothetical protein|nr:hypothetical protein [Bacteroidia bacterium]